jgi:hypothetical protein
MCKIVTNTKFPQTMEALKDSVFISVPLVLILSSKRLKSEILRKVGQFLVVLTVFTISSILIHILMADGILLKIWIGVFDNSLGWGLLDEMYRKIVDGTTIGLNNLMRISSGSTSLLIIVVASLGLLNYNTIAVIVYKKKINQTMLNRIYYPIVISVYLVISMLFAQVPHIG